MATLETRYNVGDVVWLAGTAVERKQHPCPDCLGTRHWLARSPAGAELEFACPRCSSGFQSNRELSLDYSQHAPRVERLTIGQVGFDHWGGDEPGPRYMAHETGVGGGTVYRERDLFPTEDEARATAEIRCKLQNADPAAWVAKQYHASLSVCDYQLESAAVTAAETARRRATSTLNYLISDIAEAESMDEVRSIIERVQGEKTND